VITAKYAQCPSFHLAWRINPPLKNQTLKTKVATRNLEISNFMQYEYLLKAKQKNIEITRDELNGALFDYQKDLVYLALKKRAFCNICDDGSGKTVMQG
jgi:helicase domain protein